MHRRLHCSVYAGAVRLLNASLDVYDAFWARHANQLWNWMRACCLSFFILPSVATSVSIHLETFDVCGWRLTWQCIAGDQRPGVAGWRRGTSWRFDGEPSYPP